jgi:hypothetical protein
MPGELAWRRISGIETLTRADHRSKTAQPPNVALSEPAVDQYQTLIGLDQQAVANHPRGQERGPVAVDAAAAQRTQRAAVQVVDAHVAGFAVGASGWS